MAAPVCRSARDFSIMFGARMTHRKRDAEAIAGASLHESPQAFAIALDCGWQPSYTERPNWSRVPFV